MEIQDTFSRTFLYSLQEQILQVFVLFDIVTLVEKLLDVLHLGEFFEGDAFHARVESLLQAEEM